MQRALILGPVTLTYFLWFLDLAVVSTATPTITAQFNSLVDVGWYALRIGRELDITKLSNLLILLLLGMVGRINSGHQQFSH